MKENPDSKWNKGSGGLGETPLPAKLPSCEKELKKSLRSARKHWRQKFI